MQSARPLFFRDEDSGDRTLAFVVVYSAPLGDVERSVDLVRSRIILAAIVALGLAVLAAYLVAQSLGRRVARLQHVAERVAVGDFSARFPVEGDDELGQLAKSLDLMQRQLAALDSSRRRFIATASHELRTPVFSLGGFLELLEDEDLDEETRARFLDQVRDQTYAAPQADHRPARPLPARRRVGGAAARGHGHRRAGPDGDRGVRSGARRARVEPQPDACRRADERGVRP